MDRRLRIVGIGAGVWIGVVRMTGSAIACTRVFWNTNNRAKVVGRTRDVAIDDKPRMLFCPRGLERDGKAGDISLTWKSKYGNVAMTAFGVAADDGMNEHGLAAHMINLPDTEYEVRDNRPGIGNLLWIQYFLDNCKTVEEPLGALDTFQVASGEFQNEKWPRHVALEDATGDSAVLEYVGGKLVVYHGPMFQTGPCSELGFMGFRG